jgi:hypothetical protein
MKVMKKNLKLLSILLSIDMITSIMPVKVFAESNVTQDLQKPSLTNQQAETAKPEAKIIEELQDKRTRYEKRYIKDDFSFEVDTYSIPVHYLDNGEWKDIDNTLVEETDESNNKVLTNKANDFNVKIKENAKTGELVNLSKGKYEVSWGFDKANEASSNIESVDENKIKSDIENTVNEKLKKNPDFKLKSEEEINKDKKTLAYNEDKKTLRKVESGVNFKNIYEDIDLQYKLAGDKLKENIIVNKKTDIQQFSLNLNFKNLIPIVQKDNSIIFYDEKDNSKAIFKVEAPLMFDSAKNQSSYIEIELNKDTNGYSLIINPDKDWLNSSDRQYPIFIDPTLSTSLAVNAIHDTFVASQDASNKYLNQYLRVGQTPGVGLTRTYMKFDLPSLSAGDVITVAHLDLIFSSGNSSGAGKVRAHKVLQNFDSTNLYWSNQPSYNTNAAEYASMNGMQADKYDITWDITGIVKDWYTTGNNYGLMLEEDDAGSAYHAYYSSDWGAQNTYDRPQVSFYYVNCSGLESYWTYHSQSIGRGGTGYINDYNGNQVFVHNDLSMSGSRLPVNINHVFNSNDRTVNPGGYGLGWRLNLYQTVTGPTTYSDGTYYSHVDEDGTTHYYKYDSATGLYKNNEGLDTTLKKNADNTITITDKKDNKLNFTSSGNLSSIQDSNGNTLKISYSGVRISSVTDGGGRVQP